MEYISKSSTKTKKLAKTVLAKLAAQNTLALYGNLGAGKTTFVQGLAQALGINKRILSPTFILLRSYKITHPKFKHFFHIDLYRVHSAEDLKSVDLLEIIHNPQNLLAIEWAKKARSILPKNRVDIHFIITKKNTRKIICSYP